jgi:hypothetical protein
MRSTQRGRRRSSGGAFSEARRRIREASTIASAARWGHVFMTLMRSHSVNDSDFIGEGIFVTADGTKHKSQQFILREVQVGTHVLRDVVANVVPIEGDPLLGQSFLSRLPSWSIDNNSHILNLATGEAIQSAPEPLPASIPTIAPPPAVLPTDGGTTTSSRYKRTSLTAVR